MIARLRLRDEDGYAMAASIMILLVGILLTTALLARAMSTESSVRRDGDSKRAIQAARAGANVGAWLMSTYASTTSGSDPLQRCLQRSGGTLTYVPLASNGWCPPVTQEVGADAEVTYVVSAPYESAAGKVSRDIVATGTVAGAVGGAAVTRRVRQRITTAGWPNFFDDYSVISLEDLDIQNSVDIGDSEIFGNVRSNGHVTLRNSAEVWGNVTPGPGKSATTSNSAKIHGSKVTVTEEIALPDVVPPTVHENDLLTTSFNACRSSTCDQSLWGADRRLIVQNNDRLTVTGNTFVLCKLQLANTGQLTFRARVPSEPVRVYLDAPSQCANETQPVDLGNNTALSVDSIYPLQIYVVGGPSSNIFLGNSSLASWTIYAPHTWVRMRNSFQMVGGIAAQRITFDNSSKLEPPSGGTGPLQIGGPSTTYVRDAFVECANGTPADLGQGC